MAGAKSEPDAHAADVKKLLNELRYLGVTEADAAALIEEVYEQ